MVMSASIIAILLLVACAVIEVGAEVALASWAQKGKSLWFLVLGILCYTVIGGVYGQALRFSTITVGNSLWQCFSLVSIAVIGVLFFGDRPTVGQWAGIGVTAVGTILLLSGDPTIPNATGTWYRPWSPIT